MCPKKKRQMEQQQEQIKKQLLRYETINKGDLMDYDGMGDWGEISSYKKGVTLFIFMLAYKYLYEPS